MKRTIIINAYKTYNFKDKDPVIDQLRTIVEDSKLSHKDIQDAAGTSQSLLYNWFYGGVRRPQSATIEAIGRACGKQRVWVDFKGNKK